MGTIIFQNAFKKNYYIINDLKITTLLLSRAHELNIKSDLKNNNLSIKINK